MNQRGFTLIETMISCSILTVGILGFASISMQMAKQRSGALVDSNIGTLVGQVQRAVYNNPNILVGQGISGEIVITNPLNTADVMARSGLVFDNKLWTITSIALTNQTISGTSFKGTITMIIKRDNKRMFGALTIRRVVADAYCTLDNNNVCVGPYDANTAQQQCNHSDNGKGNDGCSGNGNEH